MTSSSSEPAVSRSAPALPLRSSYASSPDGVDSNLLLLLHGLGDTMTPFERLGRSLCLPQTAILAIEAPVRVPLIENAYQWYESFDVTTGMMLDRPNPCKAVDLLLRVLQILSAQWPPRTIHILGYAQGGSVALQSLLSLPPEIQLGSIVSVCGPLLSAPAKGSKAKETTPILLFSRRGDSTIRLEEMKQAFGSTVQHVQTEACDASVQAMPRNRNEWEPIMRFWSERLRVRPRFGKGQEVVELGQG